jgi:hypothetical protein
MRSLGAAHVLLLALVVPAAASPEDDDLATRLFEEGVALREKDPAAACVKFRASLERNPQPIGTLLNVAVCDERDGKIASALQRYAEARDRAREQNVVDPNKAAEAEKAAKARVSELEPDIPHLSITLTEVLPDMRVLVDGRLIDPKALTNVPVDPGAPVVEVAAPGRVTYRTSVAIKTRERQQLTVPPLARVASLRKNAAKIAVGSGAALLGTGIALGIVATSRYHAQFGPPPLCNEQTKECQSADASSKAESARTLGTVATVVGVVGLAAIGAGAYLWLRAPPQAATERKVSVRPHVAPGFAGFAASGRF